jgi:hypothetical protein
MIIRYPPQHVINTFHRICEFSGCQKAISYFSRYYHIRRMKLVVDGRHAGNGAIASYDNENCTAYFTKSGFTARNVLHEFYHHLVGQLVLKHEEQDANRYARELISYRD